MNKGGFFVTYCLLSFKQIPFRKGVFSKRKESAHKRWGTNSFLIEWTRFQNGLFPEGCFAGKLLGSKFIPFRVVSFPESRKTILQNCLPWNISFPFENTTGRLLKKLHAVQYTCICHYFWIIQHNLANFKASGLTQNLGLLFYAETNTTLFIVWTYVKRALKVETTMC